MILNRLKKDFVFVFNSVLESIIQKKGAIAIKVSVTVNVCYFMKINAFYDQRLAHY